MYTIIYYYITIIYYTYTIISYTILSSSSDLSFLLPLSSLPFLSHPSSSILYVSALGYTYLYSSILKIYLQFCSPPPSQYSFQVCSILLFLPFSSPLSFPIFILYVSVLGYAYLYSRLIFLIPNILTPHVLSEWMVEV